MRTRLVITAYYFAVGLLVLFTGVIIFKLMFWPPCTPSGSNDTTCIVDGWSVAGLAGTVLGVSATVLALLGAFAVAAWWTALDKRVGEEVMKLYKQEISVQVRLALEQFQTKADKTQEALVYLGLGDRLLAQNNKAEAIESYKTVATLVPEDAQLNYVLGRIYSDLGVYDDAIRSLEASNPEDDIRQARVQKELGLTYRRRGDTLKQDADYDTAMKHLRKATALNPKDEDTLTIIGGLLRRREEYTQALDVYKQAWDINPNSSYALVNLASLCWFLGKVDDAHKYFGLVEATLSKKENADVHWRYKENIEINWQYYDLGLAQLAQGKIPEATSNFRLAIQEAPARVPLNAMLKNLYFLQKAPQPMPGLDNIVQMLATAHNIP